MLSFKARDIERVLVTGGTGYLGVRVVAALLELGIEVSLLIRPEQDDKLAAFSHAVNIIHADVWNRSSLTGLARGHDVVVHLVGSLKVDPARGLTYQQINLVSARNAVAMAVNCGVSNFVLLSVAALPSTLPTEYIRSKRDAEEYLKNSGLSWMILRPPSLYNPSSGQPLLSTMGFLGGLPLLNWFTGRYAPLAVNVAARGIAAAVQNMASYEGRSLYANDLRRLARKNRQRGTLSIRPSLVQLNPSADDRLDEVPFGWLPPPPPRRRSKGR